MMRKIRAKEEPALLFAYGTLQDAELQQIFLERGRGGGLNPLIF